MTVFFCIIISIFLISVILINFSWFRIEVKELEIENTKLVKFDIKLSLNLFKKIPWIKVTLNKEKVTKYKESEKVKLLNNILQTKIFRDYKNVKSIVFKNYKKIIKELANIELEQVNLNTAIGTEEADKTAYANAAVSIAVPIILGRKVKDLSYKVDPIYINKNYLYLSINCIISLKLVHIININKAINRKGVCQNNGKSSNRRTYANSNG